MAELENLQHINHFICNQNCLHLSFTTVQVTVFHVTVMMWDVRCSR